MCNCAARKRGSVVIYGVFGVASEDIQSIKTKIDAASMVWILAFRPRGSLKPLAGAEVLFDEKRCDEEYVLPQTS